MAPSTHTCIGVQVTVLNDVIPLLFEIVKCSMECEHCHLLCHLSGDIFSGGQIWGWQSFSIKSQTGSILGFACHTVSVAYSVLLLYWESSHRQYRNEWVWLDSNKT